MRILLSALGSAGVNSAIKSVAASLGKGGLTGAILGTGVAVAGLAVGLGVQAVKAAGDFQQELTQLVTGAGEVHSNLKMVGDGILKLAVDTGTSTKQLVDGMYMIESAGYHGAAGLNVLKIAAQGARVGNADLGDVANALTTILTDYHLSANQATAAMNALTTTVASGKTHLQDLAKSMGAVLPLASSLGISFPQVAGAMAVMTNAGKNARVSAQNLANTLRSLAAPNATAAKAMKEVGLSAQQLKDTLGQQGLAATLQLIEEHVGKTFPAGSVQAVQAFKAILGGATGYNVALMLGGKNMAAFQSNVDAISKAMQNGAGDVQGWSDVQADLNFQWDRAKEVVQTAGIAIGTKLLPVATKLMSLFSDNFPKIQDVFRGISDDIQHFGNSIDKVGLENLAVNVNRLGDGIKNVFLAIDGLGQQVLSRFQVGMLTAGNTAGRVSVIMGHVSDGVRGVGQAVRQFAAFLGNISLGPFLDSLSKIGDILGGAFQAHLQMFASLAQQIGQWVNSSLIPSLRAAEPSFQNLGDTIMNVVLPGLAKLWAIGQSLYDVVIPALVGVLESAIPPCVQVASIISDGLAAAFQFLMPYVLQAGQAIADFSGALISRILPMVQTFFAQIGLFLSVFQQVWGYIWPSIAQVLGGIWDQITGIVQIAWSIVSNIILLGLDLIQGNWSQAWTDIYNLFVGIWDGIMKFIGGALKFIGIDIGNFGQIAAAKMGDTNKAISKQAADMSSSVQSSFSTMSTISLGSLQMMSDRGKQIFDMFKANGVKDMSQLDAATIAYVNDMAAYLDKADARRAQSAANAAGKAAVQGGISSNIVNKNFASGIENFSGGLAYVHRGEVLANLAPGTSVVPANRVQIMQHGGGGAPTHMTTNIFNISLSTMARNQMEVSRMVDLLEQELSRRFHVQTSGYASGGVY